MNKPTTPKAAYDRSALAREILTHSAEEMAGAMVAAADLYPTNGVVLMGLAVPAGTTSAAITLTFPTDGYITGVRASVRSGDADMYGTLLRVQVDGRDDLWSSGASNGAGFLVFSLISGTFSKAVWNVRQDFEQANAWTVFVQNTNGGDIVADLCFDYVDTRNPRP